MTRYLCWLALFAVAAVPDWASALCPPPVVFVAEPVVMYPRQIVLLPPCVPVYEAPLPPPRVDPPAKTPAASVAPRPMTPAADTVRPAAAVEPVRPTPTPPPPAAPLPAPRQEPPAPRPAAPPPTPKADPPGLTLPLFTTPPAGPPAVAPAPPAPAPTPSPDAGALIPAPALRLPVPPPAPTDDPSPAKGTPPSLVLPSVTTPPPPAGVIARSSPLTDKTPSRPRVDAIPVMATGPVPTGKRKVGFYNHSDRSLTLVVNGETTTLPRGYYVQAELPVSFEWRVGTAPAERVTVPEGQAGVELLIRD